MSSRRDLRAMKRDDLEDEVMLLRAQVKVLQDWLRKAETKWEVRESTFGTYPLIADCSFPDGSDYG